MKKLTCPLLCAVLCLCLLSACGGGAGEAEAPAAPVTESAGTAETVVTSQTAKTSAAEPVAETAEPEEPRSAGPVEYDRVFYDGHGLRVTLLSAENRLAEEDEYRLNLRFESTGGGAATVGVPCVAVNGWQAARSDCDTDSDLFFTQYSFEDEEIPAEGLDCSIGVRRDFFERNGGSAVSRLGLVLRLGGEDEVFHYDMAEVTVEEGGEVCPVVTENVGFFPVGSREAGYLLRVSNPTDTTVNILCLARPIGAEGERVCYGNMMTDGSLADGVLLSLRVREGAEDMPCAFYDLMSQSWFTDGGEWIDFPEDVITGLEMTYVAVQKSDVKNVEATAEVLGRASWNDNWTEVRFTWPEDIDRLTVGFTAVGYQGDTLLTAQQREVTLDRHYTAYGETEERLLDTASFWGYGTDRWEVAVNYAYPAGD